MGGEIGAQKCGTRAVRAPVQDFHLRSQRHARHTRLALRARLRDDRRAASDRTIRQHQQHTPTDAKWSHFNPSRRGQRKPSFSYFRYGHSAHHFDQISNYAVHRLALFVSKRHKRARGYGLLVVAAWSPRADQPPRNRRLTQGLQALAGETECRR